MKTMNHVKAMRLGCVVVGLIIAAIAALASMIHEFGIEPFLGL